MKRKIKPYIADAKNTAIAVIVALIFLFPPAVNCRAQELPFKSGETVAYTLNYTWGGVLTDVGSAVCQLSYEDGEYHAVINGYTFKFYNI